MFLESRPDQLRYEFFPFSVEGTMPSSRSHISTSNTPLTPPTSVESPSIVSGAQSAKHALLSTLTGAHTLQEGEIGATPVASGTAGQSPSSESESPGPPTRASIRAWAKATPAGPPRDTPSPAGSSVLSGSDDNLGRRSITHSARHVSPVDLSQDVEGLRAGPEPGSGSSSGDDGESGESGSGQSSSNLLGDGSAGNNADAESSDSATPSDASDASPAPDPRPSPSSSPPIHRAVHPPRRPPLSPRQSSTSDRQPPVVVHSHAAAPDQRDQQRERLERRQHRHHPNTSRRRHRDRDHRERERCSKTSNSTPPSNTHSHDRGAATAADPRLSAPPVRALPPLRLITGGMNILQDIEEMVRSSTPAPLRMYLGTNPISPRRENDVLDDIYHMIRMTRQ